MDYTKQSLVFQARKALRYTRIYGPRFTLIKVLGHRRRIKSWRDVPDRDQAAGTSKHAGKHVGIIGCGFHGYALVAYFLQRNFGPVVRAAMDIDREPAASLFDRYNLAYHTTDADELLSDPDIDLVYVASNHASHADYAVAALQAGKSVHIEKPHVVNLEQLERLCRAMEGSRGRVNLGFNRPQSSFGRRMRQALDRETGSAMYSFFVVGQPQAADHWYADAREGGRVFGNLCHWTDFAYWLVPEQARYPIRVIPARGNASDVNVALTLVFGDGTIAAITFSALGETFEGVRETLHAQRGDTLVTVVDFERLTVERGAEKRTYRNRFRDSGHEAAVCNSYRMSEVGGAGYQGADARYVWETGELFIAARRALETDDVVLVGGYSERRQRERSTDVPTPP